MEAGPILLFDGVCNLCNGTVQFILQREKKERIRFAALQSEAGMRILRDNELNGQFLDSLVLIENDTVYLRSTAALRIARYLKGGWPLLSGLLILPPLLRNVVYDTIARFRYRWFGRQETCMIPEKDVSHRFIGE